MADEATPAPEAPAAPAAEAAPAAPTPTPKPSRRETNPYVRKAAPKALPPEAAAAAAAPAAKPQGQKSRALTVLRNQLEAERAKAAGVEPMRKALAEHAKSVIEKLPAPLQKRVKTLAGDDPVKALELARDFSALAEELAPAAKPEPKPATTAPAQRGPAAQGEADPDLAAYREYRGYVERNQHAIAATFISRNRAAVQRGQAKATAH